MGREAAPARGFTIDGDRKVRFGRMSLRQHPKSGPTATPIAIRRALVSVYDKTGLEELVRGLHDAGVALVSTGGSARLIEELGIPVTKVEDLTGFPECLDGRVKTLHPKVHAGILADRRLDSHVQQLAELGVEPFDLVVSNLYPFTDTVASGATPDECVEQIDIGGPSMVRAAAKNHPSVAIVTSPGEVLRRARGRAPTAASPSTSGARWPRRRSCTPRRTTCTWRPGWATCSPTPPPAPASRPGWARRGTGRRCCGTARTRTSVRRSTSTASSPRPGLAQGRQLHGKEMSYNNYVDADAAHRAAYDHGDQPTVAIIKHANPCGIAVGDDIADAHRKAHACDPVSAYGGIIATNRPVTAAMAETVKEIFTEVVVAPAFDEERARDPTAKKNMRLLEVAAPAARWGRDPTDLRRAAAAGARRDRRLGRGQGRQRDRRRPVALDAWSPARRPRRRRWRTWRSPGGRSGR